MYKSVTNYKLRINISITYDKPWYSIVDQVDYLVLEDLVYLIKIR